MLHPGTDNFNAPPGSEGRAALPEARTPLRWRFLVPVLLASARFIGKLECMVDAAVHRLQHCPVGKYLSGDDLLDAPYAVKKLLERHERERMRWETFRLRGVEGLRELEAGLEADCPGWLRHQVRLTRCEAERALSEVRQANRRERAEERKMVREIVAKWHRTPGVVTPSITRPHGRAPRRRTNHRTCGSRRTASRGDPDGLGDKPPGHRRPLIGGRR
jgi:hypothetical protein